MQDYIKNIKIKKISQKDYTQVFEMMKTFTANRDISTSDEIWCVEHNNVFTQGKHGKPEYIIDLKNIPLVQTDRGGQITYHSEGQAVIYFLINIKKAKLGVKKFVDILEKSCMQMLLNDYGITAHIIPNAHGIYVEGKKIASLGLRVKNGCTYHGIAINTNMDLTPFSNIIPCGYKGLEMTQISDFYKNVSVDDVFEKYTGYFLNNLAYK